MHKGIFIIHPCDPAVLDMAMSYVFPYHIPHTACL